MKTLIDLDFISSSAGLLFSRKFGVVGYGTYLLLINEMKQNARATTQQLEDLSILHDIEADTLNSILDFLVSRGQLVKEEGGYMCPSILEDIESLKKKQEIYRQNGQKGGRPSQQVQQPVEENQNKPIANLLVSEKNLLVNKNNLIYEQEQNKNRTDQEQERKIEPKTEPPPFSTTELAKNVHLTDLEIEQATVKLVNFGLKRDDLQLCADAVARHYEKNPSSKRHPGMDITAAWVLETVTKLKKAQSDLKASENRLAPPTTVKAQDSQVQKRYPVREGVGLDRTSKDYLRQINDGMRPVFQQLSNGAKTMSWMREDMAKLTANKKKEIKLGDKIIFEYEV